MSDVLLLNADLNPISILPLSVISWKHAINLYFMDRIHVLEEYEDWIIRSEKLCINVPSVCMTKQYLSYKKTPKFSRHNMYLRDLYQCQYCSEVFEAKDLTLDHVIPRSKGGKTTWENSVTACKECNHRKGARTDLKPLRSPYKPDHYHLINKWRQRPIRVQHRSWYDYLGIEPPKDFGII
jgi:5-methylcytosine-specific restriction endonuclease McrA